MPWRNINACPCGCGWQLIEQSEPFVGWEIDSPANSVYGMAGWRAPAKVAEGVRHG